MGISNNHNSVFSSSEVGHYESSLNFYGSSTDFLWFRQNPGLIASTVIVFVGSLVGLFSGGMMSKWAGMEVMFFGVVALMSRGSSIQIESSMKYFIIQGLGGMMIFISFFCFGWFCSLSNFIFLSFYEVHNSIVWMLLLFGLFLKMGLFPFDYWVPSVFKNCSYFGCFLVGVVQKLIPLYLLSGLGLSRGLEVIVTFTALITALKGCIMGLGIKDFRFLMGYSSLVHSGWMVMLCLIDVFWFMLYLLFYSVVMASVCFRLYDLNVYNYWDLYLLGVSKAEVLCYLWYDFLSMAGMPISVGWIAKLVGFYCLKESVFCLVVLSICSGLSLYMYISLGFEMAWNLGLVLSFKSRCCGKTSFTLHSKNNFFHFWVFIFSNLVSIAMMVLFGVLS